MPTWLPTVPESTPKLLPADAAPVVNGAPGWNDEEKT
jgi:hypothetical protein